MALSDVFEDVKHAAESKRSEKRRSITFTDTEWKKLEAAQGRTIQSSDLKKILIGIFEGRYVVSVGRPPA